MWNRFTVHHFIKLRLKKKNLMLVINCIIVTLFIRLLTCFGVTAAHVNVIRGGPLYF